MFNRFVIAHTYLPSFKKIYSFSPYFNGFHTFDNGKMRERNWTYQKGNQIMDIGFQKIETCWKLY